MKLIFFISLLTLQSFVAGTTQGHQPVKWKRQAVDAESSRLATILQDALDLSAKDDAFSENSLDSAYAVILGKQQRRDEQGDLTDLDKAYLLRMDDDWQNDQADAGSHIESMLTKAAGDPDYMSDRVRALVEFQMAKQTSFQLSQDAIRKAAINAQAIKSARDNIADYQSKLSKT